MREIKFRAWDGQDKLMRTVKNLMFNKNDEVDLKIEEEWFATGPDLVLMQYTGLKDKNGVEIFEGDILTSDVQPCKMVNQIKDGYGVVRFENGIFKLGAISLITFLNKMEVIGNIYENTEQLNG